MRNKNIIFALEGGGQASTKNLVDIRPVKLVPTWRNGRKGNQAIAKRLNKCIISEGLLNNCGLYHLHANRCPLTAKNFLKLCK
jgi:hypothetical protein